MKRLINIFLLVSLVIISACRKSDNATMPDGIVYLNQPQIEVIEGGDPVILTDALAFKSGVSLDLYFKDGAKPDYLDLVVVKNGDAKNFKVLKSNIASFPVTFEVTGQLLTDIFGEDIAGGDSFDIGANYIDGGKTYLAFPEGGGAAYGSGVASQAGASTTVRFSAICPFTAEEVIGEYKVKTDEWADFSAGDVVEVKKVSDTELSFNHVLPGFGSIIFKVDPANNTAKIENMQIASAEAITAVYGGGGAYGSLSIQTAADAFSSVVDPCSNSITLNIEYILSGLGNQGASKLVLEKVVAEED